MLIRMAWRNLWRNKTRSLIIMLSIALGLFAGLSVLALYKGMMKSRVRDVIDFEVGHIQLHDPDFRNDLEPSFVLKNSRKLLTEIGSMPGVRIVSPRSITNGMLATPNGSTGVQINGIDPDIEKKASYLNDHFMEGSGLGVGVNEIIVGKKLARKMKLRMRSKLVLTFTDTAGDMVAGAFRVAAIYQTSNGPMDERNVYVQIRDLNNLLHIGDSFHELRVYLQKDEDAEIFSDQLKKRFPGVMTETWKEISPETNLLVQTTNQYSYIIIVIIMFALAFGIINTMLMAILERTREIGMMMALGTTRRRIFLLILLETVFITLAGTPPGILVAWILTGYYNKHGLNLSRMGNEMMNQFGFSTVVYPEFPSEKLLAVLLIVAGTALVASLFPALRSLKLRPVEALRRPT